MSRRQLLGGAAILAVIATVLWYVVVAPSSGSGVAPDTSVRVALSATAAGTGTWVRYLVTVKNLADGDFAGDVLLVDHDQSSEASTPAPSLASLGRTPRITAMPAVAGRSAYQVHLSVPSRHSRTIAVLAPDFFNVVEAVMGGQQLDVEVVEHAAVVPVAVLSDREGPADDILGLRYDSLSPRVARFASARDFPVSVLPLAGYAALVIDQFDCATLNAAQLRAVRDFVGFGGTLVLGGGSDWRRTTAALPGDLLPIRPEGTATVSLAPLAALAGHALEPRAAPAAVGAMAPGARRLLDGTGGVPLAAELSFGAGKVVELAYDPSGDAATGSPYTGLGWSQAIARAIDQPPGSAPMAVSVLGADPDFTALLPTAGDAPLPPTWLLGLLLALYVAVAGPLGYLAAVRRWRRPTLFWGIVPLVALACTGTLYLVGTGLQGSLQDHQIQVLRVGAGSVNVLEYHRVLFLRRGNHEIMPPPNALVAPLTLETFRTTGSTCERCISQLGGLPSGSEHVTPSLERPAVDESGVVYGSVRVVAVSGLDQAPVGLDARLTAAGGHLQGTISNPGRQPVYQIEAFSSDGQTLHQATLADALPPGAQVRVDGALSAANLPGRSGTAAAVLLRSVAADALTGRGQVVLVALTPQLPSRLRVDGQRPAATPGLAVLQQAVLPAVAGGPSRDLERKWLASTSGDQKAGFADVYDVVAPAPAGALALTYNAEWSPSVEVYDWSRAAFAPVPAQPAGDLTQTRVPLTAEQVRDGMVRVRVHEPRISWAADVWLDP
jgi:hypothetical protein